MGLSWFEALTGFEPMLPESEPGVITNYTIEPELMQHLTTARIFAYIKTLKSSWKRNNYSGVTRSPVSLPCLIFDRFGSSKTSIILCFCLSAL